jgi:hypothetical protein
MVCPLGSISRALEDDVMARRPGSDLEIQALRSEALRMARQGQLLPEIARAVGRGASTIYRWLRRQARGKKKATKARRIRKLHGQGHGIPEIIKLSGASSSYAYLILGDREEKQVRLFAEERVEDFLATGEFPKRDPADAFGWCLHERVSNVIDSDGNDALGLSWRIVGHYRAQIHSRRSLRRKRSARCLATQFVILWSAANRVTGNIAEASQAIETARKLYCGCTDCLAEIERHQGWLYSHFWSTNRNITDLSISIRYFDTSLRFYQEMFPRYGHCVYRNGISAALFARAASRYYARDLEAGLRDSREAIAHLDPRKSPNLVVRCSHLLAVLLAETGRQEDLDEALRIISGIRQRMPEEGTIPYAKVIWLEGLIEEDGEGHLLDARDIFIEKGYVREVGTITLDLVAYYGDRDRQIRAIEALVNPYNLGAWLEGELSGVAEVLSAARKHALTLDLVRQARAALGADLMPDLLTRRRNLTRPR